MKAQGFALVMHSANVGRFKPIFFMRENKVVGLMPNEITGETVSPGRKPVRFKNRPGPSRAHATQGKGPDPFCRPVTHLIDSN
jgi:hypothetical protein